MNGTDNAIVWRNNFQQLDKVWISYPLYDLQNSIIRIHKYMRDFLSMLEGMNEQAKKQLLLKNKCNEGQFERKNVTRGLCQSFLLFQTIQTN